MLSLYGQGRTGKLTADQDHFLHLKSWFIAQDFVEHLFDRQSFHKYVFTACLRKCCQSVLFQHAQVVGTRGNGERLKLRMTEARNYRWVMGNTIFLIA